MSYKFKDVQSITRKITRVKFLIVSWFSVVNVKFLRGVAKSCSPLHPNTATLLQMSLEATNNRWYQLQGYSVPLANSRRVLANLWQYI
jgi:hypothetical protein